MEDNSVDYEAHWDDMELAAMRAGGALQRVLTADAEALGEVRDVFKHLARLQNRLREWVVLHHMLHQVLVAFTPFYNNLHILRGAKAEAVDWRILLKDWRLCQARVDQLMDFEGDTMHLAEADRPGWGWHLAMLQQEIEDELRDEVCSIQGLLDLSDGFRQACDAYLGMADRQLGQTAEDMRRLYTQFLGGWL